MAIIKSELIQFGQNIKNWGSDAWSSIKNTFSGISNQAQAAIGSLVTGSVVGINANKVPEMTAEIENQIKIIETHLDEVNVNTDPSIAFADPGMQEACKAYIQGVMDACKAYTTQLNKLADTLDNVKAYYESNQARQSDTLQTAGKEVASSVERYERGSNVGNA